MIFCQFLQALLINNIGHVQWSPDGLVSCLVLAGNTWGDVVVRQNTAVKDEAAVGVCCFCTVPACEQVNTLDLQQ
jgi:hypothetical protein